MLERMQMDKALPRDMVFGRCYDAVGYARARLAGGWRCYNAAGFARACLEVGGAAEGGGFDSEDAPLPLGPRTPAERLLLERLPSIQFKAGPSAVAALDHPQETEEDDVQSVGSPLEGHAISVLSRWGGARARAYRAVPAHEGT